MENSLIRVSKYLSKYLRHSPHELGVGEAGPGHYH